MNGSDIKTDKNDKNRAVRLHNFKLLNLNQAVQHLQGGINNIFIRHLVSISTITHTDNTQDRKKKQKKLKHKSKQFATSQMGYIRQNLVFSHTTHKF